MSRSVTKRYRRRRRIRSILSYKNPNQKEWKHYTVYSSAPVAIQQDIYGSAATALRNTTIISNTNTHPRGVLSPISQGTSAGNRIGDSTFVKKIAVKMLAYICPPTDITAGIDSVTLRVIVHNAPGYKGGNDITDFFDMPTIIPVTNRPERSNYNVYYDRIFPLLAPTAVTGATRTGKGGVRFINFVLPVNRHVEYTNTDGAFTSQVKKDRDIFTISVLAYTPHFTDGTQLCCLSWSARAYFTDD